MNTRTLALLYHETPSEPLDWEAWINNNVRPVRYRVDHMEHYYSTARHYIFASASKPPFPALFHTTALIHQMEAVRQQFVSQSKHGNLRYGL